MAAGGAMSSTPGAARPRRRRLPPAWWEPPPPCATRSPPRCSCTARPGATRSPPASPATRAGPRPEPSSTRLNGGPPLRAVDGCPRLRETREWDVPPAVDLPGEIMIRSRRSFVLSACALLAGLVVAPAAVRATAPSPSLPSPAPAGIDLAGIDRSVRPGQDFFAYANGAWAKATEIPPDRAAYGVAGLVTDVTNQHTAELIQQAAAASAPPGSDTRKIGDFYASFMDEAGIEAKGLGPLPP